MVASVADTSVVAAFLFQEPRAQEARALLADVQLYEPPLLAYELSSVCRKKILQHSGLRRELLLAMDIGLSLDIQWMDVDQRAVVELALENDLTTYDTTFLWLSRALDIPLQTFDGRLSSVADV